MPRPFSISLNNFRAFADTGDVTIKPLTLLVGENSTGKSSFLSALRYCFDINNISSTDFFNKYPFDLGSYEDIVHDGSEKKAKERFSISIKKVIDINKGGMFRYATSKEEENLVEARMTIFFRSGYGEVVISSIRLELEEGELNFHVSDSMEIFITSADKRIELTEAQADFLGPAQARTNLNIKSAMFFLINFRFGGEKRPQRSKSDQLLIEKFTRAFDSFTSQEHDIHCSPPVRSVPLRVYTASSEYSSENSSSAPNELNRVKRSDRRRWARINSGLSKFGRLSGLFTKFDIKKLTPQDAGPFQVKVTVRGRSSTIADVGYGVSQALPIMTDLLEANTSNAAFLLQQPEVHLHPRAQAALGTIFSEYISNNSRGHVIAETHSDYLIDRVRIEIREGKIDPSMVGIIYFSPENNSVKLCPIEIDRNGNLLNCPEGYREFFISEQERILGI